jgi:SNF2 family DNA or RNA helicase
MRNDKRQESLEKIKTDPTIRLILISFKAGSTGLNLTCCNNVVLMDMWWNPAYVRRGVVCAMS